MYEINWNVRSNVVQNYLNVCRHAASDASAFDTFKSNPNYTPILEHGLFELGGSHLRSIQANNPYLLTEYPLIWDNDNYGSPIKHDYGFKNCSSTTLQYINVLSNIINLIGSLDNYSIVEIGGGYAGQAKIITDVFKIKQYDIVDLHDVSLLQNTYIKKTNTLNVVAHSIDTFVPNDSYDLLISNYALTEVTEPQQSWYVENILMRATHGYITCNGPINKLKLLTDKHGDNLKTLPDVDGERQSNYIIIW